MTEEAVATESTAREALFLSLLPEVRRIIRFISASRRLDPTDAEEFGSYVSLRLVDHDYGILGQFKGRSSPATFLNVVVQRMFLDFRRMQWGKWRPSAEARRLGDDAIELERLSARDGLSLQEAVETVLRKRAQPSTRSHLERLAERLPQRVRRRFESDDVLEHLATATTNDDELRRGELRTLATRVSTALQHVVAQLPVEDQVILRYRFQDGRQISDIASALSMDARRLYRRVEALLARLRTELLAQEIDPASVRELLDSPNASDDLGEMMSAASSESTAQRGANDCT